MVDKSHWHLIKNGIQGTTLQLNDAVIRKALVNFLKDRKPSPKLIAEEINIHNGNAIADIVAIYSDSHCFEIKSDRDNINRVLRQAKYYDLTFSKITLVTTEKNKLKAQEILPEYWGILIASNEVGEIKLSYLRKAKTNPKWCSEKALLSLWKSELIDTCLNLNLTDIKQNFSREKLATHLSKTQRKSSIRKELTDKLLNRFSERSL